MAQVRGPSLAELDRAGRAFAARVRAQLREALIEGARALGATPSTDDLARVRSAWDGRVDGLLVDVADAYWAGVDRVHGRVARLVAARAGQLVAAGPAPSTDLPVEADVVPRVSSVVADLHLAAARNRLVGVGDVVWEHARAELLEGMRAGETTAQLRDRVVLSTGLAAPRAEAIARTEVNGAMNLGALDEMSTISPDSTKTWLATAGPRTRPTHAKVDGQTVKVRDKFDVSGVAMTGPHDPTAPGELSINCRCSLTYEISDEVIDGLADEAFHLPGQHNQKDHGHDHGQDGHSHSPSEYASEAEFKVNEATAARVWLEKSGETVHPLAETLSTLEYPDAAVQAKANVVAELASRLNNKEGWQAFKAAHSHQITMYEFDLAWAEEAQYNSDWITSSRYGKLNGVDRLRSDIRDYLNGETTAETNKTRNGWTNAFIQEVDRLGHEEVKDFELVPNDQRQRWLDMAVSERVGQWAVTSGDGDPRALWMQRAAMEEFDLSGELKPRSDPLGESDSLFEGYTPGVAAWYRQVARVMYEHTQDEFSKAGITHVSLFRGMNFDGKDVSDLPDWVATAVHTGEAELGLNPISSWTAEGTTSNQFGKYVFQTRVPVERVMGTARTGVGCLDEYEFVVFRGDGPARLKKHPKLGDAGRVIPKKA